MKTFIIFSLIMTTTINCVTPEGKAKEQELLKKSAFLINLYNEYLQRKAQVHKTLLLNLKNEILDDLASEDSFISGQAHTEIMNKINSIRVY